MVLITPRFLLTRLRVNYVLVRSTESFTQPRGMTSLGSLALVRRSVPSVPLPPFLRSNRETSRVNRWWRAQYTCTIALLRQTLGPLPKFLQWNPPITPPNTCLELMAPLSVPAPNGATWQVSFLRMKPLFKRLQPLVFMAADTQSGCL